MTVYVTMHDNFLSGWGGAEDAVNIYAVACSGHVEASRIVAAAEKRPEMSHIRTTIDEPKDKPGYVVSLVDYRDLGYVWKGEEYE